MKAPERAGLREMSAEKIELLQLEATGEYVFHGSDVDVPALEPRNAYDTTRGFEGGAVYATPFADYAIFMAIFTKRNCGGRGPHTSAGGTTDDTGTTKLAFKAPQTTLDALAQDASGWVYVFRREDFQQRAEMSHEFKRETTAVPVRKIRVTRKDLPQVGIKRADG